MNDLGYLKINESELMEYFGYKGKFGKIKLNFKFGKSWINHVLGYSSPFSNWVVKCQRNRGVKIGENCHISPYVLIDLIYPELIEIGDNVTIGHNTVLKRKTKVGNNVEIGALSTIGGSGFGFEKDSSGAYNKIQHYGSVCIADDVNIGDNVTIDRATIGLTKICKNVKIDNQVHIAHNSEIGANTIITASVTISGSVVIGENCWLGPNSTINNKALYQIILF